MTLPEDDLKDFFAELRAEDEQVAPPPFTGLVKRKSGLKVWRLAAPLGAAASILLLFLLYRPEPDTSATADPTSVLVISLETMQEHGTESLLSISDPVFSWESPSASLIADF
jgi:hypothetical protein